MEKVYFGTDPIEAAVYKYVAEGMGFDFEPSDVHIPYVRIAAIDKEPSPEEKALVYGTFLIENYNIVGDTLECVSTAFMPGVMHLNNEYEVIFFEQLADCEDQDAEAREMMGPHYDEFMKVYNEEDEDLEARRIATVSEYVKQNGLSVSKFMDEGWDPVELIVTKK